MTKIAIICFDFYKENIHKQPWRYVFEVAKYLAQQKKIDIIVITNFRATDQNRYNSDRFIKNIPIRYVRKIDSFFGLSSEVIDILEKENITAIIKVMGLLDFIKKDNVEKIPVIGILTSPIYYFRELLSIGTKEFFFHFKYLFLHIIGSLIPKWFIKRKATSLKYIIVLSQNNYKKLVQTGFPSSKIVILPPGISKDFLYFAPNKHILVEFYKKYNLHPAKQIILYYTAPLTLRGTDVLIKAFKKVAQYHDTQLVLLSRPDNKSSVKEEVYLKKIIKKEKIDHLVKIISKYLGSEEIKTLLSSATVVCLPFKIVLSDMPLSILEAMAIGCPVISTNKDGIPWLLKDGRGIIVPSNNSYALYKAILKLLDDKTLRLKISITASKYIENQHPRWEDVGKKVLELIDKVTY